MPPQDRNSIIVAKNPGSWTNKHLNVTQQIDRLYDVWNPPAPNPDGWGDLQLTIRQLQALLRDAGARPDPIRLRGIGGGWSLSRAAVTDGRLVNTKGLNWKFPLQGNHLLPGYKGAPSDLVFAQCGTSVQELNSYLERRGYSLKTSGASNGQTIVGAVATGTHGSAFGFGAMQDFVVGMHIIVSPDRHYWLERDSYRVVSQDFLAKLGAEPKWDDDIFNAALVSFGSFGLIHAVLIETEPIYLLEAFRRRLPMDANLTRAMQTLDFTGLNLPYPNETPFHWEATLNPYDIAGGAYVTAMYKRPYRPDYPRVPAAGGGLGPGDDLLAVIGTLFDVAPAPVPFIVKQFASIFLPLYESRWGTHGETFTATDARGKGISVELGVPIEEVGRAREIILAANAAAGPFGGFFAFRYVPASKALLAFTHYDMTCCIEFPGVAENVSMRFYQQMWDDLDRAGIPYTLHWGQVNNYMSQRVRATYGNRAVDTWIDARHTLLDETGRKVFSSPFLEQCGLHV